MPANHRLPILTLAVREQRYSCHGCGNCCRDFTVQLREEDLHKLRAQKWEERLGEPVTVSFRNVTYLRQRDSGGGACMFLMDDGKCRIHAKFGFENKPIACQLFPFHLTPTSKGPGAPGIRMGVNFACQSVLENKGADLRTHVVELQRMATHLPDVQIPEGRVPGAPMLNDRLRAEPLEVDFITNHVDKWLRRTDLRLRLRLDGLAWVTEQLARAKLDNVRSKKLNDLLDVLFGALPEELEHHPIQPASSRQMKMLRQAVFARTNDPKLDEIARRGRWRIVWSQLSRSRRFRLGRGDVPRVGVDWPEHARFTDVESVSPASDEMQIDAIDDLMTRWHRSTILGNRAWGAGYYGWPIIPGVQAMLLNVACVGWLARLHATAAGRDAIDIIDVRAAIGRIDRSSGRAVWLGSKVERLRLNYLRLEDGLRRIIAAYSVIADPDS